MTGIKTHFRYGVGSCCDIGLPIMKMNLIIALLLFTASFNAFGQAAVSKWECRLVNEPRKQGYTCSRTKNGRRASIDATTTIAKPNSFEVFLKILSFPRADVTVLQAAQAREIDNHKWAEQLEQDSKIPVPTLILYTVRRNTAFQFVVMADPADHTEIRHEIFRIVAESKRPDGLKL